MKTIQIPTVVITIYMGIAALAMQTSCGHQFLGASLKEVKKEAKKQTLHKISLGKVSNTEDTLLTYQKSHCAEFIKNAISQQQNNLNYS